MPTSIKQILFPTDFSDYSEKAYKVAIDLASRIKAGITLLHVIELSRYYYPEYEVMDESFERVARKQLETMKKIPPKLGYGDIDVHLSLCKGSAVPVILEETGNLQPDLIVMGSKGGTALRKVLVGSVAADVMLHSPVPVLIIPEMQLYSKFDTLVFATDYREKDPENLKKTIELAELWDTEIQVLHIVRDANFRSEIARRGFADLVREKTGFEKLHFATRQNRDVLEGIADYAAEHAVSLIVMNRYRKSKLVRLLGKSHTDKMLDHLNKPLLVFPGE